MTDKSCEEIFLKDYQVPDYQVESVDLEFDLYDDHVIVESTLHLHAHPHAQQPRQCFLNGQDLELLALEVDGLALTEDHYTHDDQGLTLHNPQKAFTVKTQVRIMPQNNKSFMGLYRSRGNFCTQCEAEGFRKITYFFDRPDVMTRFKTTIRADKTKYPYVLGNGNCIERADLPSGRHQVVWYDPSLKPCYLFALVAGDFDFIEDTFVTQSGRTVALEFFLERGFRDQGFFAMEALKHAMAWDEETYGREYDLDIYMVVAVSDFNMGAMENKGLNVFNTKYVLANPETATDADYVAIEDVIGHEYFHNWTGNRITCRDWFQLTLKEGLTVFRDQTFSEDMTTPAVARINEVNVVRQGQFPEDTGPLAHPIRPQSYIEINNFYTATVYRKGAEVIRMIHTLVTPAGFRKGMDLYFQRHDGSAVTTEDFVAAMSDANDKDLTQFKRWYDQAGTPTVAVNAIYDSQQRTYSVTLRQSCPDTPGQTNKLPFHMPFSLGLLAPVDAAGDADHSVNHTPENMQLRLRLQGDAHDHNGVLELTQPEQTFVFVDIDAEPIPSLNRGFSAPVKVEFDYTEDQLAHLVLYDTDPVARWDASQTLFALKVAQVARCYARGESVDHADFYPNLLQRLLQSARASKQENNLLAQLLTPTSLNIIYQLYPDCDVVQLQRAREWIIDQCAQSDLWRELFDASFFTGDGSRLDNSYTFDVESMGRRAARGIYAFYAAHSSKHAQDDGTFISEYFLNANNMTDKMNALLALNNVALPAREQLLAAFYEAYQQEPLVVNKWLTLQASSTLPGTLEQVKKLTQHQAYDQSNPNNVYALICAFGANLAVMHREQAAAYRFIADQVIEIDKFNPQVAARVLTPLTRWRQWDSERGRLMHEELIRIRSHQPLSSDVYEMVEKSVAV